MTDQQIADAIRTALATHAANGAAGVVSVTIDGIQTQYNFDKAVAELEFWERRAAKTSGKKTMFGTLDLRNL